MYMRTCTHTHTYARIFFSDSKHVYVNPERNRCFLLNTLQIFFFFCIHIHSNTYIHPYTDTFTHSYTQRSKYKAHIHEATGNQIHTLTTHAHTYSHTHIAWMCDLIIHVLMHTHISLDVCPHYLYLHAHTYQPGCVPLLVSSLTY